MMKKIDLNTWKRTEIFNFFNSVDYPFYSYSFNLDITNYLKHIKEGELPFSFCMVYAVARISNGIEAFRYRFDGADVVLYDRIDPSIIVTSDDPELMKILRVPFNPDVHAFIKHAKEIESSQTGFINYEAEKLRNVLYTTSNPWIPTTQFTNTISFDKTDAIPRFFWGRYFKDQEKTLLPFTMQVHHGFVDGYHTGLFYNDMCKYLAECPDLGLKKDC